MLLVGGFAIVLGQWAVQTRRGDSFTVGAPSPETYRVIAPIRYDDLAATKALREMAGESVVGVTVRDMSAKARLQRRLESLRSMNAANVKAGTTAPDNYVPEALLNAIARLDDASKTRLLNLTAQAGNAYIDRLESKNVFMDSAQETALLWEEINRLNPSVEDANLIYQILLRLGNLNFRTDPDLTALARQTAMDDIPSIERRLEPGDVIVSRNEIVTPQAAVLLRLQGYTEDAFPVTQLCSVLILVLLMPLWFKITGRDTGGQGPSWLCVVFIILVAWGCETLAMRLRLPGAGMLPAVLAACLCVPGPFAFNAALAGTTSCVFIIRNLAFANLILMLTMAVIASMAGYYLLRKPESRTQVRWRIFCLAVLLALFRTLIRWLEGIPLAQEFMNLTQAQSFWVEVGCFMLFEITGTHILLTLLPMIEDYLGALSILRLREISHPSSPLLRTMQREAPGTYQHCLTIATLIEAVAAELGMDVNLVKAGAYYHDIGKLRRPQFFVENQGGGHNTHDEMSPMLSAITIISHVNEGLQLAWEAKLPRRIRDFIAEHHGTTCVRYFYNKALSLGENVEWQDFCYPGPKPRSRETALLMIVDSTEAAVRSMNLGRELLKTDADSGEQEDGSSGGGSGQPHENRGRSQSIMALQKVIDQVVTSKLNEGQFENVNFTLRDLSRIKEALFSALLSMYHTRRVKKIERPGKR